MPTIFAASESKVLVNGEPVEGVRAIEYRHQQVRENVFALGSTERIGLVSGPQYVDGRLKVTSTSPAMNAINGETQFQITAQLKHGSTSMTVTFDECYLQEKTFDIGVGGHGEATYVFTATRVREEAG
jgi:hypothetical protein